MPLPIVADVGFERGEFVLLNRDGRVWRECRLMINPTASDDGYFVDVPAIGMDASYRTAAENFATAAGARFNPRTQKPLTFRLRARVGDRPLTWDTVFRYDRP